MNSLKLQETKSICKKVVFLYTYNKQAERELRNNPIYSCIKKNKISENKPDQAVGDGPVQGRVTLGPWQSQTLTSLSSYGDGVSVQDI